MPPVGAWSVTAPRKKRLLVTLNEEEHALIKTTAAAVGMSMSRFLRVVGLGHQPQSILDHEQVREVIRARGDLGRVGGLLKLWLTERAGAGAAVEDVRVVLNQIEVIAEEVRHKVRAL